MRTSGTRYNARTAVRLTRMGGAVLGVDPGLIRTGWALVRADDARYRLVAAGVVAPRTGESFEHRLAEGFRGFCEVLDRYEPDVLVMEDLFATPRFPRSALKMAHLRGVLCLAAALRGIDVVSMTATTVKQRLTGNGHASKEQVQQMVFNLCDLGSASAPSDLSDAVALAIAGLHQIGNQGAEARG